MWRLAPHQGRLVQRPSKPFETILVWKLSRFARSREDSIIYKTLLRKHGVQVISITEPFEDTPTGRLLEAMIESLDEFYSANLGQEVLRGMRENASSGASSLGTSQVTFWPHVTGTSPGNS